MYGFVQSSKVHLRQNTFPSVSIQARLKHRSVCAKPERETEVPTAVTRLHVSAKTLLPA